MSLQALQPQILRDETSGLVPFMQYRGVVVPVPQELCADMQPDAQLQPTWNPSDVSLKGEIFMMFLIAPTERSARPSVCGVCPEVSW
jgi:hypothetical protein